MLLTTDERRQAADHATQEFNLVWANDQELYLSTLGYARELLARVPGMTDQTLGRNVKDRVFSWAFGGGWGHDAGWPGPGRPFEYFLTRGDYALVSEEGVAEQVRECLDIERAGGEAEQPACIRCGGPATATINAQPVCRPCHPHVMWAKGLSMRPPPPS